ncbi:MAG TPA: N-acetyltransferase [Caulobacteraceae bacterium]|jgi:predicted N-acetyltransferase YhbS|nr:N-acetyltransferase [Caulobacteraceae bacterium]
MSLAIDPQPPQLATERPQDADAIERLVLRAFGPGRFAKAAERLREGREPQFALSVTAWDRRKLVGSVRQWTVRVGETPAIFLGPIAVEEDYRSHGVGAALIERACAAAARAGHAVIVLVGDTPFFGPLGFAKAPGVIMPGPVDQSRVLARALLPGADRGLKGPVVAA